MIKSKRLRESELKENSVKKYEVTSQINSSGSFSIKIKRIYSHHDDDTYTIDKMIMERVNDDCLAEIFMYMPAWERPKMTLICKKWKRALDDSWFNVKKLELTYWRYDEYPHFLEKNYPTFDGQLNFLKSLLNKCGHYLRELDLSVYPKSNIVPVINEYCPNLVKLRIRIKFIDNAILNNAFTRLSKLKVLKIIFQCFKKHCSQLPVTLINSLLNVADTLTELNLSSWTRCVEDNTKFPEEMTSVISKLTALKKIHIAGIHLSESLFNYLSSTDTIVTLSDEFLYNESKMAYTIIYEDIKTFRLNHQAFTNNFLYNIANLMRNLSALYMFGTMITDAGIVALSKMNHLKILEFRGFNNVTDSSIELLKNMRVLTLPWSKKITDKSVTKVLENSPEMRYLCLEISGVTSEFINKAKEISKIRKKRLELDVSPYDIFKSKCKYFEYLTLFYPAE